MVDVVDIRAHAEQMADDNLKAHLKMAMRAGDDTRVAIYDQEIRRRRGWG